MAILRTFYGATYSDELRRSCLRLRQGKGSLSELAEDFGVILGWLGRFSVKKLYEDVLLERQNRRP